MSKRSARKPAFSRLSKNIPKIRKRWYKQKVHRANRKRVNQAFNPQDVQDKPLNSWALD